MKGNTKMATTVTSKGQVTIPKKVRDYLGIKAGSAVDFALTGAGEVTVRLARAEHKRGRRPRSRFEKLRGTATVKMSTDEIMALTRGSR
jgi:AbrB family looped-hinge helix DNA binding protein